MGRKIKKKEKEHKKRKTIFFAALLSKNRLSHKKDCGHFSCSRKCTTSLIYLQIRIIMFTLI